MRDFKRLKKKLKKPQVILIRHGATDLNNTDKSEDRIRGWIDVPLNDQGREDAAKAAKKLEKVPIDAIFSSDLCRARETAEIINKDHDVPIPSSKALRPWNLGDYNGAITDQVIGKVNALIKTPDVPAPNGESFKTFSVRYLSSLKNIMDQAIQDREIFAITTHLRNLKMCDGWFAAGCPDDYSVDPNVVITDEFDPGGIYEADMATYMKHKQRVR
jgi:broad specificity phosphatase PhoE